MGKSLVYVYPQKGERIATVDAVTSLCMRRVGAGGWLCRESDPCDVRLYVVPSSKVERAVRKLDDSGYDAGPEPSDDFSLREGLPLATN